MLDLAATAVDHREAFDSAVARGLGHICWNGLAVAVGVSLHIGVLRDRFLRHILRHHQRVVFGDEAALRVEQSRPGAGADLAHHRAGGMGHVVIERGTKEGETARHRRLYVGAEAEGAAGHFRHAGKAAIELDGAEILARAADQIHRGFQHGILRVAFHILVAIEIVARLFSRGTAPDMHHAVLGHAGGTRFRKAGDEDRGRLVDHRIGDHQLGIGPRDQPVVGCRCGDLFRCVSLLDPCLGIGRSDTRIA